MAWPADGALPYSDLVKGYIDDADTNLQTQIDGFSGGGITSVNGDTGPAVTLAAADVGADAAGAAAAAASASQPLDSDLTAIAALTTTSYGRALLTLANQAALLAAVGTIPNTQISGLGTASTQATSAFDAAGAAAAAQSASQPADSDLTAIAALTTTSYGRSLLTLANQAALVTALGNIPESQVTNLTTDLAAKAPVASPTFTGPVTLGQDAASGLQSVSWQQWQAALTSQDAKDPVAYASTSALPANTYANGSSGVGATLTGNANGPLIVDGVTILVGQVGERVLVGGEATASHNGIFTITQQGVVAVSPYILTRSTDFDQPAEVDAGDLVPVSAPTGFTAGSANNGKVFLTVVPSPVVFGTSAINFSSVGGTYSAGTGLSLTSSTFAIDTSVTVDKTTAQTLTNKTLTAPAISAPTGILPSDVALTDSGSVTTATTLTAVANKIHRLDTTSNAITVTLPTSQPVGTQIELKIVLPNPLVNQVTWNTSGSDVINRASGATTGVLKVVGQYALFQYIGSNVWVIAHEGIAVTQMDARYDALGAASAGIALSNVLFRQQYK